MVPFILGALTLLLLYQIWLEAEPIAEAEEKQGAIVQHLDKALDKWGYLSAICLNDSLNANGDDKLIIKLQMTALRNEFAELHALTIDRPQDREDVDQLQQIFLREAALLSGLSNNTKSPTVGLNFETLEKMPTLINQILLNRAEIKELLNRRWHALQELHAKQDQFKTRIRIVAYASAIVSIVLAFLFAIAFARSITERLQRLILKTKVMSKNRALERTEFAQDEIAYLDEVLCQSSRKLQQSEEHRRSIIGMVAHDVRSPLSAAGIYLDLIEQNTEEISKDSQKLLRSASRSLSAVVEHVQTLLGHQKTIEQSKNIPDRRDAAEMKADGADHNLFFKRKIFQGALILMTAPLLAQFASLFLINKQIAQTESIAAQQRRMEGVNIYLNFVRLEMVKASGLQAKYLLSRMLKFRSMANRCFDEVRADFAEMQKFAAGDPAWEQVTSQNKNACLRQIDRLLALNPSDPLASNLRFFTDVSEVQRRIPEAVAARLQTTNLEEQDALRVKELQEKQHAARSTLSMIFAWSIFANLIMVVGLVTAASTSMTKRMQILMTNAIDLGNRQPLNNAVAGDDEIASLDATLRVADAELQAASRQRLEQMLSLTEEIRAPLLKAQKMLRQFAELNAQSIQPATESQLARAQLNIDSVLKLINDLLMIEAVETATLNLDKSVCDVCQLVEEALSVVSSLAIQKNITLVNSCKRAFLESDRARIVQVLVNYLSNAVKFSPEHSTISVSSAKQSGYIKISVSDQGSGIDKNTQQRLFEKFFQGKTESRQQGFGLGLAACKLIAECHGGRVGVVSDIGKGSTFWLELPC